MWKGFTRSSGRGRFGGANCWSDPEHIVAIAVAVAVAIAIAFAFEIAITIAIAVAVAFANRYFLKLVPAQF